MSQGIVPPNLFLVQNLEPDEVPAVEAWLLESWPLDPADFSFKSLINSIEDILEHRRFKTGECIVKQGDPVREMFYVSEGEVQIVHVVESDSEDDDFEEVHHLICCSLAIPHPNTNLGRVSKIALCEISGKMQKYRLLSEPVYKTVDIFMLKKLLSALWLSIIESLPGIELIMLACYTIFCICDQTLQQTADFFLCKLDSTLLWLL